MPRLFDFFSKGKEKPEWEVHLPDLEEWLRSRTAEEFKEVNLQGDDILRRLRDACSAVKNAAEEFSRAEIKAGELDQHLLPTIRNSRDSIASKVVNIVSKLEFPEVRGFDSLVKASRTVSQALAQMDQTLKTHGRVVSAALAKDIRPLLSELKWVQREASQLSKLVETHSGKAETVENIRVDVFRLLELNLELMKARTIVEDGQRGSEEVEAGERKIARNLEEVLRSKEYEDSQRIAGEAKDLGLKLRSLQAEFDTAFSKLRKPLDKYGYTVQLGKEEDRLLKLYVESPSTGLMEDKELVLEGFLGELKGMVSSGKVVVKNTEKVLRRIDELRSTLKSRQDTIKKMTDDLEDMHTALKRSPIRKAEDMRKALEKKRLAKEEQMTFIEKKRSDTEETSERLKNLASKIEAEAAETFEVKLKIRGLASEGG